LIFGIGTGLRSFFASFALKAFLTSAGLAATLLVSANLISGAIVGTFFAGLDGLTGTAGFAAGAGFAVAFFGDSALGAGFTSGLATGFGAVFAAGFTGAAFAAGFTGAAFTAGFTGAAFAAGFTGATFVAAFTGAALAGTADLTAGLAAGFFAATGFAAGFGAGFAAFLATTGLAATFLAGAFDGAVFLGEGAFFTGFFAAAAFGAGATFFTGAAFLAGAAFFFGAGFLVAIILNLFL